MGQFREMILNEKNDRFKNMPVTKANSLIKGNTIEKNITSAIEYFTLGENNVALIAKKGADLVLIYTKSGDWKKLVTRLEKESTFDIGTQAGKYIDTLTYVGYATYTEKGIKKIVGAVSSDKIGNVYI